MSRFYSGKLGPTLKVALEKILAQPSFAQMSLQEEVALVRAVSAEALVLASVAFEPAAKANDAAKASAIATVQYTMEAVAAIVERAARVEALATDKLSVAMVDLFVSQTVRAIYRVLGEAGIETAKALEAEIRGMIRLPKDPNATLDSNIEVNLIRTSIEPVTEAMDSLTAPSNSGQAVEGSDTVQDRDGRPTVGEN